MYAIAFRMIAVNILFELGNKRGACRCWERCYRCLDSVDVNDEFVAYDAAGANLSQMRQFVPNRDGIGVVVDVLTVSYGANLDVLFLA
jgi:hypothetical protein